MASNKRETIAATAQGRGAKREEERQTRMMGAARLRGTWKLTKPQKGRLMQEGSPGAGESDTSKKTTIGISDAKPNEELWKLAQARARYSLRV